MEETEDSINISDIDVENKEWVERAQYLQELFMEDYENAQQQVTDRAAEINTLKEQYLIHHQLDSELTNKLQDIDKEIEELKASNKINPIRIIHHPPYIKHHSWKSGINMPISLGRGKSKANILNVCGKFTEPETQTIAKDVQQLSDPNNIPTEFWDRTATRV